ncbi:MAG: type II toxin-antitoxin system Phd/YefM family antitoxin [Candidatus Hydrogenedentes bacterium]|nr:type II toxin-antitoxin system Phd/YefM family antitoxin [Candidatus Hydrogenedentota bacterium]
MTQVTVERAAAQLPELLKSVRNGEEVIITEGECPVAKLIGLGPAAAKRRAGTAKGLISIAADFDAPLPDFDAYMQ